MMMMMPRIKIVSIIAKRSVIIIGGKKEERCS